MDGVTTALGTMTLGLDGADVQFHEPLTCGRLYDGCARRCGDLRIDARLPEGYAPPTAPGLIEIKTYGRARRAQVTSQREREGAFWPLLGHRDERNIPVAAPIELDLHDDGAWTMALPYPTPTFGVPGPAGRVLVVDAPARRAASIGMRGECDEDAIRAGAEALEIWLAGRNLQRLPSVRVLSYNGPLTPTPQRWWEVQVEFTDA